jgi:hypothetical protein
MVCPAMMKIFICIWVYCWFSWGVGVVDFNWWGLFYGDSPLTPPHMFLCPVSHKLGGCLVGTGGYVHLGRMPGVGESVKTLGGSSAHRFRCQVSCAKNWTVVHAVFGKIHADLVTNPLQICYRGDPAKQKTPDHSEVFVLHSHSVTGPKVAVEGISFA